MCVCLLNVIIVGSQQYSINKQINSRRGVECMVINGGELHLCCRAGEEGLVILQHMTTLVDFYHTEITR